MSKIKLLDIPVPEFNECKFCVVPDGSTMRLYESFWEGRRYVATICDNCVAELASLQPAKPTEAAPQWTTEWPTKPGDYWLLLPGWQEARLAEVVRYEGELSYSCRYGEVKRQLAAWTPANIPNAAGALALLEGDSNG